MIDVDYLILGGGVSGLTFAAEIKRRGLGSIRVLEKEDEVGGLCRSADVDGAPLDIGGGHFLDMRNHAVLEFVFRYMPRDEWVEYSRISKIDSPYKRIDYPYEANIWQFPVDVQVEYLKSIATAGCNLGDEMPEKFSSWIEWKLGKKIADDYMLPYNHKIFSMDLDQLGTYWLYKLPDVSFEDTLKSCLERKPAGKLPAHAVFLYPREYGYGELWRRIGESLGDDVSTGVSIDSIDFSNRVVNGKYKAKVIINTIPWQCLLNNKDMPDSIREQVDSLVYSGIDVDYVPDDIDSDAHWIYVPDEDVAHHRKLLRSNFLKGAKGYWTETNSARNTPESVGFRFSNEYAYPVNTINKPDSISEITDWASSMGVVALGRWGEWEHMNSDVACFKAIELAASFLDKDKM